MWVLHAHVLQLTKPGWVCSGEMAAADPPVYWPERKYSYGTAEAFNTVRRTCCAALCLLVESDADACHAP